MEEDVEVGSRDCEDQRTITILTMLVYYLGSILFHFEDDLRDWWKGIYLTSVPNSAEEHLTMNLGCDLPENETDISCPLL